MKQKHTLTALDHLNLAERAALEESTAAEFEAWLEKVSAELAEREEILHED